jgi:Phage late-transcription coactivator
MYLDEKAKINFSSQIMKRVEKTNLSYMDCVLELAEEMGIEPNTAGKLLSKPIIEKIQEEARDKHFLKGAKNKKLPIDG